MAKGSLNLKVSKSDFERRLSVIETRMATLMDVINRYNTAKTNLDQFIENGDDNYQAMIDRIDQNVTAAKKAHAALGQLKMEMTKTVTQLDEMSSKVKETITSATEATKSTVEAAIKVAAIL